MKKILWVPVAAALFCGCNILPSGDPPEGNILNNTTTPKNKTYTVPEATDYLISSFTMYAAVNCPGQAVQAVSCGDNIAYNWAVLVVSQSGKITGNQVVFTDSPLTIEGKFTGDIITLTLCQNGRPVWQESVKVVITK